MKHSEYQYLDVLERVANSGVTVGADQERTGTGTKRLTGQQMRFDLREWFPLLTTKRVHFRNIVLELLWMLSGETKVNSLAKQWVRIWNDDAYRVYLNKMKVTWTEALEKDMYEKMIAEDNQFGDEHSDLWPIYGKQRRSLSTYKKYAEGDQYGLYTRDWLLYEKGEGIDQVSNLIVWLKHRPYDRWHILDARNVAELDQMGLRPCHHQSQYLVSEIAWKKYLDCVLNQRSGDLFLGVPYNIASYALLTHMLSQCIDAIPGELIHTIGDAHIYMNHLSQVQEILTRTPRELPKLGLNKEIKDIFSFTPEDIKLINYNPHSSIKAELRVW